LRLIGVTGGIFCGKTTVSAFFKELGAHLIDADKITHDVYRKDGKIKRAILESFGKEVLRGSAISRKKLGEVAFLGRKNIRKLCAIVHPAVIEKIKKEVKNSKREDVVIDAPLLIETGLHKAVDYVVVVTARPEKQILRGRRKGLTKEAILRRSRFLVPIGKKIKCADFVVRNNKSKKSTRKKIYKIWKKIREG